MKNFRRLFFIMIAVSIFSATLLKAQDEKPQSSPFSVGADFYSNYIWRGTKFGTGPAFQPSVSYATGGLTIGVWGSFDAAGYTEADAYVSYDFDFGLSLGVTDYYYPGLDYFNLSDSAGSQAFEINLGYSIKGLSLSGNYILNKAGGAASAGGDKYFQASYDFKNFNIFLGAGDGWHTSNGDFKVCNVGIGTSKTIDITDKFSVPVTGQVILNPDKKQLFLVVGFTL
jgi:hypothetical protein